MYTFRFSKSAIILTIWGITVLSQIFITAGAEVARKTEPALSISEIIEENLLPELTGENLSPELADADVTISEISDEIFTRIEGKTSGEGCPIPREDLRYLTVLHQDLDGNTCVGEMIVNYHFAEDVLDIMKELYRAGYPIEKIRLADKYNADDEASMEDNNTSAFNFRLITGSSKVSKHALGLAVDINPLYNPYIKYTDSGALLEPLTAGAYLDREADFPYKIMPDDLCCQLFALYGFEWGGYWQSCKDYQHFETPDALIREWYPYW